METIHVQAKSTKDRLDELRELQNGGYVTESEFKIARVNILKDGGIDVVTQLQHTHRPYLQHEREEEPKGCGCFLVTLLLTAILVLSAAFFAAPYWPDSFGGVRARSAREWFTTKSMEFIESFFGDSDDGIPDPVSSGDVPAVTEPYAITEPSSVNSGLETEQQDNVSGSVTVPRMPAEPSADQSQDASAAPLDTHISPQPPVAADPAAAAIATVTYEPVVEPSESDVSAPEIQTPVSSDLRPENAIQGSVTAQSARIRSAPDTSVNDNVVGRGRAGDRFFVLEEGVGKDGSPWYHIMYEGGDKQGWIRGSLVRLER